ncbi:DUF4249 domain-containing protein [Christiangramia sabulilitoris]|uniref:DUF4249 domain-containing protein n=1 Tax=Christiangramia sabulilitoris TaxID=2583991 RepID=A0A550I7U5_9FLAO|nr:DUF4249 domain-containing protein [Christiangramia sabulilitoris]TRO67036.1 DUF4249 domain-containing protein [Christiangramia sabulilitoris]
MKKITLLLPIFLSFLFSSCEEVIDLELEESEPRLVIEASILWFKGDPGTDQTIRLSETSPFYDDELNPVETAVVKITSETGDIFDFTYTEDGTYRNNNFDAKLNASYELTIEYEGQSYKATEKLIPVTNLEFVEQTESGGFSGEDIEIKAYYKDPAETEDYYLFKFFEEDVNLEIYEDEFTNGNQIFGYFSNEDIEVNDIIEIEMQGISKRYYEYLFILRSQVGSNDGGPFETMPATVKGNIVNQTNPSDFPFGYFRLSEVDSTTYIVE